MQQKKQTGLSTKNERAKKKNEFTKALRLKYVRLCLKLISLIA